MCGSMWESSPLSCSSPRWHSVSIAILQLAGFDLAQVIDDEDLDLVVEASKRADLLQQSVVGEAGNGGDDLRTGYG